MKAKTLMRRMRGLFRWKKPANPVDDFLKVMHSVEDMEKDGMLLVSSDAKPGIVLNNELANYFHMCYLIRMHHYTEVWGMERFLEARIRLKKFGEAHNPDEELLNLCRNARMVINFRRAALVKQMDEEWSELQPGEPLFITFMNETLTGATHIGYEINGEITLEPTNNQPSDKK